MQVKTLSGCRVLVVEDEYLIAMDLCDTLDREGAIVVGPLPSLHDAMDALDAAGNIDVAVLDINLGGESVYPLVDALRAREIPQIFTTGYDTLGVPERYRGIPMCCKPAHIGSIIEVITQQVRS